MGVSIGVSWSTDLDWQVPDELYVNDMWCFRAGWHRQFRCVCTDAQLIHSQRSWEMVVLGMQHASTACQKTCHSLKNYGTKGGSYQQRINGTQYFYLCWCGGICYCCQFFVFVIILNVSDSIVVTSSTSICQALKLFCSPWCVKILSGHTGLVKCT